MPASIIRFLQCFVVLPQPLSSLRLRPDTHSDTIVAIGVMSGGPNTSERVAAVRSTWLADFPNAVVMADRDLTDSGVESPPSKFYCSTKDSHWERRNLTVNNEWSARGRCTQQRFLYLILRLHEKYPEAPFYMLVDDDTWVNSVALKNFLFAENPKQPFLMGHDPGRGNGVLYSGPGFIFSNELVRRLDASTLMTQASLWEFSCSFRGCCDYMFCHPDDRPQILQDFNMCNSRLLQKCGNMSTTKLYESCIGELGKNEQNKCEYAKTMPEYPVPMYYEPDWKRPPPLADISKSENNWGVRHGCDHVLSFAARQVGGLLVGQPRLFWYHRKFEQHGKDVCTILGQHQLSVEEIVDWHHKWRVTCQK